MSKAPLKDLISRRGDVVSVDLFYPTVAGSDTAIEIALMSVRAAADLRVEYDFKRDGWAISMLRTIEGKGMSYIAEPETYVEQAFVPAWAAEEPSSDA